MATQRLQAIARRDPSVVEPLRRIEPGQLGRPTVTLRTSTAVVSWLTRHRSMTLAWRRLPTRSMRRRGSVVAMVERSLTLE